MSKLKNTFLVVAIVLAGLSAHADVVISEIMYHPSSDLVGDEFIELYNSGPGSENLEGWCFDGILFCFGSGHTIDPSSYLLIAGDLAQHLVTYGPPVQISR